MVINDGDIMPLSIFSNGIGLNTEAYIKWLEKVIAALHPRE